MHRVKTDCSIRISRTSSNKEEDYVTVEVNDEISGIQIARVKMSLLEFANTMTRFPGLGTAEVAIDAPIGFKKETKNVHVDVGPHHRITETSIRTAVKKHEIEGWIGTDSDAQNHHRRVSDGSSLNTYLVRYHRYVDPKTRKPKE
jgi:hypothetical protein